MRILITGGAGFLGSALARRFDTDGHHVEVLDCFRRGKDSRVPPHIGRWRGDIRDSGLVYEAVKHAEVIFHLAYVQGTQTFYAEPRRVIDVALSGMMNVLHACDAYPGKELFLVSSSEAYQVAKVPTAEDAPLTVPDVTNPRYSYGGGKIACEVAAMAYAHAGVFKRMVIARPHNVIGADMGEDHVVPQIARRVQALEGDRLPIQGDGTATRCFNHIDDCVEAFRILLDHGEHMSVYHVGDPREEVSIGELALQIARFYGRNVTLQPSKLPEGSPLRRVPDISKLRALGYEPRVGLTEALERTLDWYRLDVEAA